MMFCRIVALRNKKKLKRKIVKTMRDTSEQAMYVVGKTQEASIFSLEVNYLIRIDQG